MRRLEERAIAAGLTTDEELDAVLARLYATASPVNGAQMVARAWDADRGLGRQRRDPVHGAAITPAGTGHLTEPGLAALVTQGGLIGTAAV